MNTSYLPCSNLQSIASELTHECNPGDLEGPELIRAEVHPLVNIQRK
jgi:hypothetical protein